MKLRKREIAKAGIFGTKETPRIVTQEDIKELAETFPEIKTAPVQFGHTTDAAAPRLGKVVSVYCDSEGNSLCADIEEDDVLADAVDSGYYPDVSIGAKHRASDGKMYLHHLAYLGQEPPAIKGLIAGIKEPLGIAAADIGNIVLFPSPAEFCMYLSDPINTSKENSTVTEEEAEKLREENQKLKEEFERIMEELKKRDIILSDAIEQGKKAGIERLKEALNKNCIPRPRQEYFLRLADAMGQGTALELSDITGEKGKISSLDALVRIASWIPRPVELGALNLGDSEESGAGSKYRSIINKG